MSMRRLRKHLPLLRVIAGSRRPKQCQSLLQHADKEFVECLCECIQNVTQGNLHIDKHRRQRLVKHKGLLRRIIDKRTGLRRKRKLLTQSGGFLPLLLAPIIGLAGSLIGDAISGAINR